MLFGLTIDQLNFSSNVIFTYKSVNILRKVDTLELLAQIFVLFLRKLFHFESKDVPNMFTLPYYLSEILSGANDPKYKALFQVFFFHIYVHESGDQFPVPKLIFINGKFYITPLFSYEFSYSPDSLTLITRKDSAFLFDTLEKEENQSISWKLEHGWLYGLKKHVITKENGEKGLWLAEMPENIIHQLYKCYEFLFEVFKTFPFTSDEADSKKDINNYIIAMIDFLDLYEQNRRL